MRWDEIARRVKGITRPRIAEVGVWRGKGANNILRLVPDAQLTLVDPWVAYAGPKPGETADARIDQAEMDRIADAVARDFRGRARILRMPSVEAASLLHGAGEHFDLVFIDGDHTYEGCKTDVCAWWPLAASWIGGHDYLNPRQAPDGRDRFPGVTRAVDEAFGDAVTRGSDSTWWAPILLTTPDPRRVR
jgi:hypothetical protein